MMKRNRDDGSGWEWGLGRLAASGWTARRAPRVPLPAPDDREPDRLVDQKPGRFHRHVAGWHAAGQYRLPVRPRSRGLDRLVTDHFGEGIITWNTPFLFRTQPRGSRFLICGPSNYFKGNAHPLMA